MKVKYLFFTGMISLLLSCTNRNELSKGDCIVVPDQNAVDSWINVHFEHDRIVPIETTKDYILGSVRRVILYKERLIILDGQWPSIFVLNANTGRIETHINHKGRGPGESNIILDIAFDDKLEQILAFNDFQKILYFDLNGNFLKEEKVNGFFENISFYNGNITFYHVCEEYFCYPYTVSIFDPVKHSWKKLGIETKVNFPPIKSYGRLLVKSKNIWFSPILSLDMNTLDGDTIKTLYHLVVKNKLTEEVKTKSLSEMASFYYETIERQIIYGIQSIRETDKYLIFNNNLSDFMILNKNTSDLYKTNRSNRSMEDKHLGLRLLNYFPHDGDDNRIMFVVTSDQWMSRKPYNGENMPENLKAEIEKVKVDEKIESNPILIFYKEKNHE